MTAKSYKLGSEPRAIISALGSRGDVNPMLAIALALKEIGFRPLLIVAENYIDIVRKLELDVDVGIERELFDATIKNPNIWRPIRGPKLLLADLVAPSLPKQYELISKHFEPGNTLLVAHPLDLAARIFKDAHPETPLISVHLAPATIRSLHDPPQLASGLLNIRSPRWAVEAAYGVADRTLLRTWVEKPLNDFRRTLDLAPIRNPLKQWWYSPDLVLCLFPESFGPRGLPERFRPCGFPLYDGPETEAEPLPPLVLEGKRPIVFTPGSAHVSAKRFFEVAVRYCETEKAAGLMLTADQSQVPESSWKDVVVAGYVPLKKLLPHCRAIVHHGGIGTTSQALTAGIPQVICPMAFDQFDNGRRVVSMGNGACVRMSGIRLSWLKKALGGLSRANNSHHAIGAMAFPRSERQFASTVIGEVSRILHR